MLVRHAMSGMLSSGQFGMAQMFAYGVSFNGDHLNINNIVSAVSTKKDDVQQKQAGLKQAIMVGVGVGYCNIL